MIDSTELLKEEQWRVIIQECNRVTKSGEMTKREWLKENIIREATFYKWQQRLRNQVATKWFCCRKRNRKNRKSSCGNHSANENGNGLFAEYGEMTDEDIQE